MEKYLYTCHYCGKEYKPNRRRQQRFCSNSCRTNAFNLKNKNNSVLKPEGKGIDNKPQKVEKMSWAGVGNAAAGTLAVNLVANLLTSDENKPATKKDLNLLKNSLNLRYHRIMNLQNDNYGNMPYYDIETKTVVYLTNESYARTNR